MCTLLLVNKNCAVFVIVDSLHFFVLTNILFKTKPLQSSLGRPVNNFTIKDILSNNFTFNKSFFYYNSFTAFFNVKKVKC